MLRPQSDPRGHRSIQSLIESVLEEDEAALGSPIHAYAPASHLSPPRRGGGPPLPIFALPARTPRRTAPTALLPLDQLNGRGDRPGNGDPEARVEDEGVLQKWIVVQEENLKELSRQMGSQTRLLNSCRERLRMPTTLKEAEQSEDVLGRDIDALLNIREVRGVEVLRERLCVLTDTIDTVVAGKRYRLGRFRLDIRFNGDVAIRNLTRAYGYYDHPHVWNAKPCLGNIGPRVLKIVREVRWV